MFGGRRPDASASRTSGFKPESIAFLSCRFQMTCCVQWRATISIAKCVSFSPSAPCSVSMTL
jgi:hypothetical protein